MGRRGSVLLGLVLLLPSGFAWTQSSGGVSENEVLELLRNLDSQELVRQWETAREDLSAESPPSPERLDEIFSQFAASARTWTETSLLPTWANAALEGRIEEAAQALRTVRRVADSLTERNLDQLLGEAVSSIDRAVERGEGEIPARGHQKYAEALEHARHGDEGAAREALQVAREALLSIDSPFVLWIDYQLASTAYLEDAVATQGAMTKILERVGDRGYWPLRGWCRWMRGLAYMKQGAYAPALEDYEATHRLLQQAKDNSAAVALGLQASVYQALGLSTRAWELRLQTLRELAIQGNRPQLHNYLYSTVLALLDAGETERAGTWGDELLANAEVLGDPTRLAEATRLQGEIQAVIGQHSAAQATLNASRAHAQSLPPGSRRAELEAAIDVALGSLQVDTEPQSAVDRLTEALDMRDGTGHTWQLPRILRDRARAYGNLGDTQQQRKDLETALREVDRRREEPGEERFRISYWETVQGLVDDMVRFQALTAQDPQEAFLYAEQARGRALLDRLRAGWSEDDADGELQALEQGFPEVEKIREIQRLLPKGALLVEAAVLDENLILWLLDRKDLEMRVLHVEAKDLVERVEGLRSQMNQRAEEETVQEAAGDMFELLFGSVTDRLHKAEHLIVVPDRTLHRLPWAVLFDREEKKYLVENHALTVLPSASILTLGRDREPFGTIEEGPVLVVGDPAFNRDVLDLERLPGAAEEAKGVAGLYGRSTHLSDVQATRSQLLEALGQTRVLHVAGHVQVNERDPLQSSIPLTPESEDDLGLLHAREIYDLPLSNVELVVLSACRSVDGFPSGAREGVAGLARAFLAAGAGAVVASLWDVYDEPSRKLMEIFHGHFREGVPPAEALRRAQISLLESDDPQLRNPASWAGFEALGWAF